ncbi:MAG TPA: type II toxin-antitoxin system HicA family toxin [Pirellulales bacterium]|nr:type II toxin-antitoxin system HicA family toxin [Pirellulales bacterium]
MASEERFAVIQKQLERAGYQLARISGSHHIFEKPGKQLLSIPVHKGKVKPFYVRQIQRLIEEE